MRQRRSAARWKIRSSYIKGFLLPAIGGADFENTNKASSALCHSNFREKFYDVGGFIGVSVQS
jgi:hypothetical protein